MSTPQKNGNQLGSTKAPTPWLCQFGRLAGAVGLVLLISTPLTWLLTAEFGPLVWGKLAVSVACLVTYLLTNKDFFARIAGARSSGLLAMSALSVVLVIGLVTAANVVAYKHPKEFDLTREKLYTLSEKTTGILQHLQTDVLIQAFVASHEANYDAVRDILDRYKQHSAKGKLTFDMIDPQSRPDLVEQYQLTELGPRIVVSARGQEARVKEATEQDLTEALIKVTEQGVKTVYFLTGHGERDVTEQDDPEGYKAVADGIRSEGYGVEVMSLIKPHDEESGAVGAKTARINVNGAKDAHGKSIAQDVQSAASKADVPSQLMIPAKVDVLVIASPKSPLLAPELAAVSDYLERGGRLVALLDPNLDAGLTSLLASWKIEVHNDLVVDTNPLNRLMGLGPAASMALPTDPPHVIGKDINAAVVMMTARSLAEASGGHPGVQAEPLLMSGESAWGETALKGGEAAQDDKDYLGPVALAMVASRPREGLDAAQLSHEARVVVFGDSDWASNRYLSMQANLDMMLNTINWAAEQEERISIRPHRRAASQLFLSGEDLGRLKFVAMDIVPVLIVAFGLGIVLIRRQR